ncbi:MAG: hypothetical protein GY754_13140 [bacterium]|nr:hypothetical protein [bacterium]
MRTRVSNIIILILTFLLFFTAFGTAAPEKQKEAAELLKKAVPLMDAGKVDESIILLKKAREIDPGKFTYTYELSFAYMLKKEYKKGIAVLESMSGSHEKNHQYYQMLGSLYDYDKQPNKARKIYGKGRQEYPKSGALYLESGILEMNRRNASKAVTFWKLGTEMDPYFSSNYYHLARVYAATSERYLAVIYGETFMNLEPESKRSREISRLLFSLYNKSITWTGEDAGSISISFTQNSIAPKKNKKPPLGLVFELTLAAGTAALDLKGKKQLNYSDIVKIRKDQVDSWVEMNGKKGYTVSLFNWLTNIKKSGHFEAYNRWIFSFVDIEGYKKWRGENKENQAKIERFVEWANTNRIVLDGETLR